MKIKTSKNLILSKKRKTEIERFIKFDFEQWKVSCNEIWESNEFNNKIRTSDFKKPSWKTFATANPVIIDGKRKSSGVRGCVAFYKIPCMFKKRTKSMGCSHCALSLSNKSLYLVSPNDQIFATKTAIAEITDALGYTPPILEILPDGSFLNEDEVSTETQTGIFKLVSKNKSILQIAIESRPEYISTQKIKYLLGLLRGNQILEIYIGLESIDPFVLNKIIKKGFTIDQFERKIKEISDNLSDKEKRRVRLSVYHFFKPPYLTEKESIEAAIVMAKKVKEYEDKTGIRFSVKYEPAVISIGTFQKYLFDQGRYIPPNYFSIAEIIGCLYREKLLDCIKFGQRDDIDDFQTVAGVVDIKNPAMFSPFDFIVYNAVQRFNADQDIWGFCADISIAIENATEFKKWEEEIYGKIGGSSLSHLFSIFLESGFKDKYKERIELQKKIWKILDKIEYDKKLSKHILKQGKGYESNIKKRLLSLFLQADIKILQMKNIKFFDIGKINNEPKLKNTHSDFINATQAAVYQIEVIINNEAGLP